MIPARLSLRNFLCYREPPPLEFTGVQAACLTGENGNGKSALLDAMTWALWGKARGKGDGELVALGATDMEVDFEFFVGEARYRVQRKLERYGSKGQTRPGLYFYVWAEEGWRNTSGSVNRETEKRILDVLKLSYQTFINSAFLMQGRADEFTRATPAERKDVLAEILDLGRYDEYEVRAKTRRNDARVRADALKRKVDDAGRQLAGLPAARAERDETQATLDDLREQLKAAQQDLDRLIAEQAELEQLRRVITDTEKSRRELGEQAGKARQALLRVEQSIFADEAVVADAAPIRTGFAALARHREHLRDLEGRANALRSSTAEAVAIHKQIADEVEQERAALRDATNEVGTLEGKMAGAHEIEARAARLAVLRGEEEKLTAQREAARDLQEQQQRLTRAVEDVLRDLERRLKEARERAETNRAVSGQLPRLQASLSEAEAEIEKVERLRRDLAGLQQEEKERAGTAEQLRALVSVLRERGEEYKRKRNELAEALKHGEGDCPLCRSVLGSEGLIRIQETYAEEARSVHKEYTDAKVRLADAEAAVQLLGRRVRDLGDEEQRRRNQAVERKAQLEPRIEAAKAAQTVVVESEASIAGLEVLLAERTYARQERAQLAVLEQRLAAIGYDAAAHQANRTELETLKGADEALIELRVVAKGLEAAQKAVRDSRERIARREGDLSRAGERVAELQGEFSLLPLTAARADVERYAAFEERLKTLEQAESRLPELRDGRDRLLDQIGQATERMQQIDQQLDAWNARTAELETVPQRLADGRNHKSEIGRREQRLGEALGGISERVESLEALEQQTASDTILLAEAQREAGLYEELTRAFGKSGVQALIIESALPEIEAAANELLARMTNNRMQVTLKSQRENKQGSVRETLEIEIADEWGTRAYEMFSGGEAFRINLALRIALSKLLARRAGAPLPTLVIDEGFGTQDASGRERLVEALTAIRDDFQCLLLVTHIEELKDVFDVRIEVVKGESGSVATVVAC